MEVTFSQRPSPTKFLKFKPLPQHSLPFFPAYLQCSIFYLSLFFFLTLIIISSNKKVSSLKAGTFTLPHIQGTFLSPSLIQLLRISANCESAEILQKCHTGHPSDICILLIFLPLKYNSYPAEGSVLGSCLCSVFTPFLGDLTKYIDVNITYKLTPPESLLQPRCPHPSLSVFKLMRTG